MSESDHPSSSKEDDTDTEDTEQREKEALLGDAASKKSNGGGPWERNNCQTICWMAIGLHCMVNVSAVIYVECKLTAGYTWLGVLFANLVFAVIAKRAFDAVNNCAQRCRTNEDFHNWIGQAMELAGHKVNWLTMLAVLNGFAWYFYFYHEVAVKKNMRGMEDYFLYSGFLGCLVPASFLFISEFCNKCKCKPIETEHIVIVDRMSFCKWHCGSLPYVIISWLFATLVFGVSAFSHLHYKVGKKGSKRHGYDVYDRFEGIEVLDYIGFGLSTAGFGLSTAFAVVFVVAAIVYVSCKWKVPHSGDIERERDDACKVDCDDIRNCEQCKCLAPFLKHHARLSFTLFVFMAVLKVGMEFYAAIAHHTGKHHKAASKASIKPDVAFYFYLAWIFFGDFVIEILAGAFKQLLELCDSCQEKRRKKKNNTEHEHDSSLIVFYY